MANKITPKQHKAIPLLVLGNSQKSVAESIGITERTMGNWLKNRSFRKELRKALIDYQERTSLQAIEIQNSAIAEMKKIMQSEDASNSEKMQAAKILLNQGKIFSNVIVSMAEIERLKDENKKLYMLGRDEGLKDLGLGLKIHTKEEREARLKNWDEKYGSIIGL
jgi:adenylosuccinate synthase